MDECEREYRSCRCHTRVEHVDLVEALGEIRAAKNVDRIPNRGCRMATTRQWTGPQDSWLLPSQRSCTHPSKSNRSIIRWMMDQYAFGFGEGEREREIAAWLVGCSTDLC